MGKERKGKERKGIVETIQFPMSLFGRIGLIAVLTFYALTHIDE